MKLVDTKDAIGHVLCHDITRIVPGECKGPVFKKGHVVKEEDIEILLSVGKEHLYVWEMDEGMLHEDDAAVILKDICMGNDSNMFFKEQGEGKIEVFAALDGVLKVNSEKLFEINSLSQMMIATIRGNFTVRKGDKLAGTRIIPLVIEKEKMERAKKTAENTQILSILPFRKVKYGIVTTGSEVYKGLIQDAFGPVLKNKMSEFDAEFIGQVIVSDNREQITKSIHDFADKGADIILCSGGMSVDPDDMTPGAIQDSGAVIESYGAPILPGAMFLLSYLKKESKEIPVLGIPGCVMYSKRTIFDLVLPRLIAGEKLRSEDLSIYGEGGLCLGCKECHFPNCSFGR